MTDAEYRTLIDNFDRCIDLVAAALRDYDNAKAKCGGDWSGCELGWKSPYDGEVERCKTCRRHMEIVDAIEAAGLRPKPEEVK